MLSKNVRYYGSEDPLPKQISLRAGPLSAVYENGDLRYIKLGRHEILRRVYVAIRDHNWDTILPVLSNVQLNIEADSFEISYEVENKQDAIDFFWRGHITGDSSGTITFSMDGEARTTFHRNRIGFCILHPGDNCMDQPCTVYKVDGSVEQGRFPKYIAPHQPFFDMQAIAHEVLPGLQAKVAFSGDTFEMEDQRNWTDASYKTYCTPLGLPFPVEVKAGTRISQSVTLTLSGQLPDDVTPAEETLTFTINTTSTKPLPEIGLGVASHGQPLNEQELTRLKAFNLAHLRIDLHLSKATSADQLRLAAQEAAALNVPLEVALFVTDQAETELQSLLPLLQEIKPQVAHWLIFHEAEKSTTARWISLAREVLTAYDPAANIGAGTNAYFTELNRERPPVNLLDFVSYSINPQVHAFDNSSLVETVGSQAITVESARQFVEELPIIVSPVTLQPRFNPNATGPEPEPAAGALPSQVDVHQMALFGAAWTVGSLKALTATDLISLTYFETTGWRGVMERAEGSPLPELFRSSPGMVFPMYHIFADVGEFAGGQVLQTESSDSLRIEGLALQQGEHIRILLANMSAEQQTVQIRNLTAQVDVRMLDETSFAEATTQPEAFRRQTPESHATTDGQLILKLLPYAVARIDQG